MASAALNQILKTLENVENLDSENSQGDKASDFKFKEKFTSANNKYALDKAILALGEVLDSEILQCFESDRASFEKIVSLFAQRSLKSLQDGQICEIEYLFLYKILKICDFLDARFATFAAFENLLFAPNTSEVENILFLQVCAVAKMFANGADAGLKFFVQNVCLLDMDCAPSNELAQFIVQNFDKLGADFELVQDAFKSAIKNLQAHKNDEFSESKTLKKRARSVFNWQLHCFWNVPAFFNNTAWLNMFEAWREYFYALLQNAQNELDSQNLPNALHWLEQALYTQFFIYHMCGNCFHTQAQWRDFCAQIDKIAAQTYQNFAPFLDEIAPKIPLDSQNDKREIVAFLKDRIVENSPYKVEFSLFENLIKSPEFSAKYRIKIYDMSLIEKSFDDENLIEKLQNLGVEICQLAKAENANGLYNSHLNKALILWRCLQNDGARVLISPNNGYGISDFLLAVRACKAQIYYSHGNFVYDLPHISERITHICNAQKRARHENFDFVGISVKMNENFYNPSLSDEQCAQVVALRDDLRSRFGAGVKILGTIGRLVKIDSTPYLRVIVRLLAEFENAVYLACGVGNVENIKQKISEICKEISESGEFSEFKGLKFGGVSESSRISEFSGAQNVADSVISRFIFAGHIDANIYGRVIDFWPDSFPLEQGESRIEFAAKGGIYLTLSSESRQQRESRISEFMRANDEILRRANFENLASLGEIERALLSDELVAFDVAQYESKAREILRASEQNLQNLRAISLTQRKIFDYVRATQGVESMLELLEKF